MSNLRNLALEPLAARFKALSHPNRLRIFLRLVSCCAPGTRCSAEEVPACVGDLGADLDLAPSTVSHHLKELHRSGLIAMQRSGQRVECWIPPEALAPLARFFSGCYSGEAGELLAAAGETEEERDE